jgi:hypothetical protein
MTSQVIERTDVALEASPVSHRPFAVVGAVITDDAIVNVTIGGNPMVIDIVIEERVPDGEGLGDTLQNIATHRRTCAGAGLDDEGAQGLLRLLGQAIAVRRQVPAPAWPTLDRQSLSR